MDKEENMDISEHKRVKRYFEEELKRRDKIIDRLKEEKRVILDSSFKKEEERAKLREQLDKLHKSHQNLLNRVKKDKERR